MVENKMEKLDFWIRYFKEHTNTIGCVELDGLDCREVLALLQELADKKVDKPNKMSQVAALFGKRLGEEFTVSVPQYDVYGEIKDTVPVKGWFDSRGFRSGQIMIADSYIFAELLEGEAVIVDG
jgi:hypothetical protein